MDDHSEIAVNGTRQIAITLREFPRPRLLRTGLAGLAVVGLLSAARPAVWGEEARFSWVRATPEEMGTDRARLLQARDYARFKREDPHRGGSGFITRGGTLVLSWGSPTQLYQIKSATKAVGISVLGLAILDGRMALTDTAKSFHPTLGLPSASNAATGSPDKITILHLATMTAGFDHGHWYDPLLFEPGTKWSYSNAGANWLGECQGKRILPKSFVEAAGTTRRSVKGLPLQRERTNPGASNHCGLLWWNNQDGAIAGVPTDTFWAWGGMMGRDTETLIIVIPSLDVVVARAGTGWGDGTIDCKFLKPFIAPIAESVTAPRSLRRDPCSRAAVQVLVTACLIGAVAWGGPWESASGQPGVTREADDPGLDPNFLSALEWRSLGPPRGGRFSEERS